MSGSTEMTGFAFDSPEMVAALWAEAYRGQDVVTLWDLMDDPYRLAMMQLWISSTTPSRHGRRLEPETFLTEVWADAGHAARLALGIFMLKVYDHDTAGMNDEWGMREAAPVVFEDRRPGAPLQVVTFVHPRGPAGTTALFLRANELGVWRVAGVRCLLEPGWPPTFASYGKYAAGASAMLVAEIDRRRAED